MKITIDVEITPRTKQALKWVVLPLLVLAGSAGVVHASLNDDVPVPYQSIGAGKPIVASHMKALFDDLDRHIVALEAQSPNLVDRSTNQSIGGAKTFTGTALFHAGATAGSTRGLLICLTSGSLPGGSLTTNGSACGGGSNPQEGVNYTSTNLQIQGVPF